MGYLLVFSTKDKGISDKCNIMDEFKMHDMLSESIQSQKAMY